MSLDFSLFHSPDQSQSFCNDLLDTLKKRGVARLTNHGIPDDVIFQLFDMVYLPTSLPYPYLPTVNAYRPAHSSPSPTKAK